MDTDTRPFDIILVGSTGFTGRRAAAYLKTHAPESLTWGLAARNETKLNALADKLNIESDRLFIADNLNRDEVDAVVSNTKIIITTAGPFSKYGENIVASCAAHGTHYLDITGEVGFIKKMRDKYESEAIQNQAKLIPFSGFDSVPADIAAYLLSNEFNTPDELLIRSYYSISGGFNGGTIATMMNKFESGEYKEMNDPQLLVKNAEVNIAKDPLRNYFGFKSDIGRWVTPFIMGPINSKIVYNTAAEMNKKRKPYADHISYMEFSSLGKLYNPLPFFFTMLILLAITKLGPYAWFRTLLQSVMPDPGEGPSEESIEQGYFKNHAIAISDQGTQKELTLSYPGDPGNKTTVFFLCESALLLAEDTDIVQQSGFLTPMAAFGQKLIHRLEQNGLEIRHPE